ncbi:MAG: ribose-phosphate diphosphokinase [Acidobacteria bacterium]|nr:ribose-phosphate diphosphokinase [Acidobacteriota bacterium]
MSPVLERGEEVESTSVAPAIQPVPLQERKRLRVFSGTANTALTAEICAQLHAPVAEASIQTFSDGETYLQIKENVRGMDVFVVQPTCAPVDKNLMEMLLMLDALRRASAKRITAVLPYYGYSRQDRKDKPRVPISAKLVASLLETAGANRVLTMDLHAAQIQGFFDVPVDHLYAAPVMAEQFRTQDLPDLTIISPDAGGVERARGFAKRLRAPLAIIDKRRDKPNHADVMNVIGEVRGRTCLIVDDLVDTAGTLCKSAQALMDQGAVAVSACCTHPVLSGEAVDLIAASPLKELWVSDSIPLTEKAEATGKIKQLSVALLFARAIASIHDETSISELFD